MLLLWPDGASFLTDPRYAIQASTEVDCPTSIAKGPLLLDALKAIRRRKLKCVGFDAHHITAAEWHKLMEGLGLGYELKPVVEVVEELRMIKSEGEIDAIALSVKTNSKAFDQVISRVRVGLRERDIASEIDYQMRRFGASGTAFETIVASGTRSALPHARPTRERLAAGALLLVDMGATQAGYTSDMTRMAFTGRPGPKIRAMYKAVLEAQLAAIDAVRGGIAAWRVDAAARTVLKAHGLDKAFVHSTGHGLGLEIHESPRVARKSKTRLQPGMVITIEPGAYVEGFGGVRIEDTVLVTRQGCEVLTPTPKELMEL